MNFLTLFARNLWHGPYTDVFPFGPATTPEHLRARITFDPKQCEGCRLCEKVCPAGAIRFTRTPGGMTFDCWHATCVFCGTCEFYCPTKAVKQSNDWHLAHEQGEKYAQVEHGLIPNQICVECGAKALDTSPAVSHIKPPLSETEVSELRARCPKCRNKYLRSRKTS